jgi:ABC-type bacteriocin/lantibiotic exporter with double-glycine peptidase domain
MNEPIPENLSSARFLLWLIRRHFGGQTKIFAWSLLNMGAVSLLPVAVGLVVQAVMDGAGTRLLTDTGLVLVTGVIMAASETMLHRATILTWIGGATRLQRLIARQTVTLSAVLPLRLATGEIVRVSTSDIGKIASCAGALSRLTAAAVVALSLVGYLVAYEPRLGLLVVGGLCAVVLSGLSLLRIAARYADEERDKAGQASEFASDTVAGLRVLRGIGGEELFLRRYARASQLVRVAAVRTARISAIIETIQVSTSGLLLIAVVWQGTRLAEDGRITVGQLITVYGVVLYLMALLRNIQESTLAFIVARPSMKRVAGLLGQRRGPAGDLEPAAEIPAAASELLDPASGLVVPWGKLTAVVCGDSDEAERVAERLGGHPVHQPGMPSAELDGIPLDQVALPSVRAAVLVQDKEPFLFSGTLEELLDVPGSGLVTREAALAAAQCDDVLHALARTAPEGCDVMAARVSARGRSLSGGQRQRLVLARSLIADPEVLVLDDPTSAVDSHTEAAIADSLRELRSGRTTVVFATSPLVLDRADGVVFVQAGQVVAKGTHRELLAGVPAYHAAVTRMKEYV